MGLRTGAQYLAGLKDDREIWYDGKRIEDPTTEPGLRNTALTVAQYYDMQCNPELEAPTTASDCFLRGWVFVPFRLWNRSCPS